MFSFSCLGLMNSYLWTHVFSCSSVQHSSGDDTSPFLQSHMTSAHRPNAKYYKRTALKFTLQGRERVAWGELTDQPVQLKWWCFCYRLVRTIVWSLNTSIDMCQILLMSRTVAWQPKLRVKVLQDGLTVGFIFCNSTSVFFFFLKVLVLIGWKEETKLYKSPTGRLIGPTSCKLARPTGTTRTVTVIEFCNKNHRQLWHNWMFYMNFRIKAHSSNPFFF